MSYDALKSLCTYKVNPEYKMVVDRVTLLPLSGCVAIYIPYAEIRISLPLT